MHSLCKDKFKAETKFPRYVFLFLDEGGISIVFLIVKLGGMAEQPGHFSVIVKLCQLIENPVTEWLLALPSYERWRLMSSELDLWFAKTCDWDIFVNMTISSRHRVRQLKNRRRSGYLPSWDRWRLTIGEPANLPLIRGNSEIWYGFPPCGIDSMDCNFGDWWSEFAPYTLHWIMEYRKFDMGFLEISTM